MRRRHTSIRAAVDIWAVDTQAAGAALDDLEERLALLPHGERERVAASSDHTGAQAWQRGRVALRLLLATRVGLEPARAPFELSRGGRPSLQPPHGIAFSLAHSGSLSLIALADQGPLGVDVEARDAIEIDAVRRDRIEAAAAALACGTALPALGDPRRFVQAWTRLEALAKASGQGIGSVLLSIGVHGPKTGLHAPPVAPVAHLLGEGEQRLRIEDLDLGTGAVAAAAVTEAAVIALRPLPTALPALEELLSATCSPS